MNKKENTILEEPKQVLRKIAAGLSALIIVFLVCQVFILKSEVKEIKDASDQVTDATEFIVDFGTDLNEIRELLLLPTKNYTLFNEESYQEEIKEEDGEDSVIADMFEYVNQLSTLRTIKANQEDLDTYLASEETKTLLANNGLTHLEGVYTIQDELNRALLTIYISEEDGSYSMTNFFDEPIAITTTVEEAFETQITNLTILTDRIDALDQARAQLGTILYESGATYDALTAKGMWSEAEYDNGSSYDYYLVNQDQNRLATLTLAKASPEIVTWSNPTTGEMQPIEINADTIATLIEPLDATTYLEQKIAENSEKLESLLQDPAFQVALSENQVTMSEAREDDTGIYYDLTDVDGNVLSTIYIDKNTGKVMVTNGGETVELIAAVSNDETKKKLWICLKPSRNTANWSHQQVTA